VVTLTVETGTSEFVLLTDRAWPDADIERSICAEAGWRLLDASECGVESLPDMIRQATGILTNWVVITGDAIRGNDNLRAVTRMGVGTDNIDLMAAAERGVSVSRIPDYCTEEVADHVLAATLAHARGLLSYDRQVHAGEWAPGSRETRRLSSLTIGIWGSGQLGRRVAERFVGLGCRVLMDDRHPHSAPAGTTAVAPAQLVESSDVLSLHLPLNPQTRGIVDGAVLAAMPPGALLVNAGRGALVDLEALQSALESGRIVAALDVLPDEPNIPMWLREQPDVILTPHVAFASRESIEDMRRRATTDLVEMLAGRPPSFPVTGPLARAVQVSV
jgi:D-3-phosphoglycerate dehydrogenase